MNDFVIKDMHLGNIDDVVKIEYLSFNTPWTYEAFISELTRNKVAKYRVLLKNERVIGYYGLWLLYGEGHITNIAIHPEFRGIGLGKMLLDDILSVSRENKMHALTLEVRVSNHIAIKLYKKYGFIEVARRKGYYSDTGEDAIIMWKYDI
ncbi:Mycothiol acetyltransferase [Caloramator mitchellensis]|uniref:[Ribosomal protein bS18]-alanine N-acetyltransferase n=1 Tax=Caloramator mitchellensis TaxID=908809 RepID=A0A0R3K3R7_CALMK|nr:ribosomal protein S18-alanine N-acetyltransferase [Caloramator mitchellensis]KRQ87701.1 Mycothiol acetyltransferase [Caloramator mitchellensis]